MRGSLSGTLATMGAAVPYAIGAKFAHPDRPAIALAGDGALQMNGLCELLTIARYADRWADRRCVVCVLHNNDLSQVTWELRAMGGAPKFEPSQTLPDVSYADFARGIGLEAVTVRAPDELAKDSSKYRCTRSASCRW
jgi:pyruvate dehydrogenase (quinone)